MPDIYIAGMTIHLPNKAIPFPLNQIATNALANLAISVQRAAYNKDSIFKLYPVYQIWITFDHGNITNTFEISSLSPYDVFQRYAVPQVNIVAIGNVFNTILQTKTITFMKLSDLATLDLRDSRIQKMKLLFGYRQNILNERNAIETLEFVTSKVRIETFRISEKIAVDTVTLELSEVFISSMRLGDWDE